MKRILVLLLALLALTGCGAVPLPPLEELYPPQYEIFLPPEEENEGEEGEASPFDYASIPEYAGTPYVIVNDNVPYFTEDDLTTNSYESYAELDAMGRCGVTEGCIGPDLMPTEEREAIGQVKPSGWQTVKYDIVDGKYLYNRCHLIGFQLAGENANERNLITGTRAMNTAGMLPFEELVADYVRETGNHVLYRVTPVFVEEELVARGVLMEGRSVEDEEILFCVFAYNNQPGIEIDYATGGSAPAPVTGEERSYILNTSSKKFHEVTCTGAADIKEKNRQAYTGTREVLVAQGYAPCGKCEP